MSITTDAGPWSYTAGAGATTFAYSNKIYAATDLVVTVDGATKSLSDYDVTGIGVAGGGNVVFNTAMAGGEAVVIASAIPAAQASDLLDNGRFPAAQVTDLVDKPIRILQQQEGTLERSLRVASTEDALSTLPDAAARRGKVVMFEDTADADATVGTPTTTVVGNASTSAAGIVELATSAETQAGSDATRAVTPAGLAATTATEIRAGVVELATSAEAIAGTDTARAVTPAGLAAAVTGLGWRPLARFVPTAAATFLISGASYFAATYTRLRLHLTGIRPATDNDDLRLRVTVGGVAQTGASDYAWFRKICAANGSSDSMLRDDADATIEICTDVGNAAAEHVSGVLNIEQPASASVLKLIDWHTLNFNGTPLLFRNHGEAAFMTNANAIDGLQFYWSSGGNFVAAGGAFLEGLKEA